MLKGKWAIVIAAVFFLCAAGAMGLMIHQARAEGDVSEPTAAGASLGAPNAVAAVMKGSWAVIVGPITKGGDVMGYNVYVFQEKTGMLWAWEHGAEEGLVRIPTREERGPLAPGLPRGQVR